MIIPHEIIPRETSGSWNRSYYIKGNLLHNSVMLVLIANLHIQKKINDKKRNAMFASLREDKLIRKIGTYHCTINDRWYNDESTFSIFCEAYEDKCVRKDLTVEEFLPYLNLYLGKPRNYCLNYIFYEYIKPLLDNIGNQDNVRLLRKFNIKDLQDTVLSYEEANHKYDLGLGYCCEDCDGCFTRYKQDAYHFNYERHDVEKAAKLFIDYLNSLKVGRWKLAPIQLEYKKSHSSNYGW